MLQLKQSSSIKSQILDKVSEQQIFEMYIGKRFEVPCTVRSPLRGDKNPSFGIFLTRGKLKFKDQATGNTGDAFDLVKLLFGLNYNEALIKVIREFDLDIPISGELSRHNIVVRKPIPPQRKLVQHRIQLSIKITRDSQGKPSYTEADIAYWSKRHIKDIPYRLTRNQCFSTQIVFKNGGIMWQYEAVNPIFTYIYEYDTQFYYKSYRPLSPEKGRKFYNDMKGVSQYCVHGLWLLPKKGNVLIITKSGKDAIILDELGYNVVAIQGEGSRNPIDSLIIEDLKSRFKEVYLLYDNDFDKEQNWGQIGGEVISKAYNITNIVIPSKYKCTDSDELMVKYGATKTKRIINELVKDIRRKQAI